MQSHIVKLAMLIAGVEVAAQQLLYCLLADLSTFHKVRDCGIKQVLSG
jgi:hypothetical protein